MAMRSATGAGTKPLIYGATALSIAAAFIHVGVIPEHMYGWWGYGLFAVLAAVGQGLYGVLLIFRPWRYDDRGFPSTNSVPFARAVYLLGIVGNAAIILLYLVTRTVGIPFFGPDAGVVLPVTPISLVSKTVEVCLVAVLITLYRRTQHSTQV